MNLYLHIGTEKTGSSHLQSMCALNREKLSKKNIWFYKDSNEDNLLSGRISAGNAQFLTDSIDANNFSACVSFLSRCINQAKENKCNQILLSNELLVLILSKQNNLEELLKLCKKLDIKSVDVLLILRDPIDQALSLYKHRAKSGKIDDIEVWSTSNYKYGKSLLDFFNKSKDLSINLKVRKYDKTKGKLENLFFKEWLGIGKNLNQPPRAVNPSLSLSELALLKKIRLIRPELVSKTYEVLFDIDVKDKSESKDLLRYYQECLSNDLSNYNQTWELCNTYLPDDEKLEIPKPERTNRPKNIQSYSFSDIQLEEFAKFLVITLSFKMKFDLSILKLKGIYRKFNFFWK